MKLYFRGHDLLVLDDLQLAKLEKFLNVCIKKFNIDEILFHPIHKLIKQFYNVIENLQKIYPNVKLTFYSTSTNEYYAKLKQEQHLFKKRKGYYLFDAIKILHYDCFYPKSTICLNQTIIDKSDVCIFFFQHKTIAKRAGVTAHAFAYAKSKKKIIYNFAYK